MPIIAGQITGSALTASVDYTLLANIPAGIVSGAAQVAPLLPAGTVSSSGQVDYNSITNKLSGVVSSSTQVQSLLPGGTVSASNQVDITATTNYSTFSSSLATVDVGQTTRIDNLASLTSSYAINSTIQGQLTGVVSSSAQVAPLLPGGTVSSSAQTPIRTFTVTNAGPSAYVIDGVNNPTLTLIRGFTYNFNQILAGHPFWIQTVAGAYSSGNIYSSGITNNGVEVGVLTFTVPYDAPNTLYYVCQYHSSMAGTINIKDVQPSGLVSSSGQVDITATTNYTTFSSSLATVDQNQQSEINGLKAATGSYAINATIQGQLAGVASSSAQVKVYLPNGTVSSSAQYPGWVTASSQIDYNSIQNKLSGVISSSTQFNALTGTSASFAATASSVNTLLQTVSASGDIAAGVNLVSNFSSGDEGGEIQLARPQTNSSISGSVTIDIYQNKLRIFEAASPNRGAFIDFTGLASGVNRNLLGNDGVVSSSGQVNITATTGYSTFSSSIATKNDLQDVSIDALNAATSSYAINSTIQGQLAGVVSSSAQVKPLLPDGTVSSSGQVVVQNTTGISALATTGSNTFTANQIITGSLFISQNLTVMGSSSIGFISQSNLDIGTNIITVNTLSPGTRFGGLSVIDSGSSPKVSGSIFFDSINDQWLFVHQQAVGAGVTSSLFLQGPQTFNNIGNETNLTTNRIPKSQNAEHLSDSQISDNGVTVSITNGLTVGTNLTASNATISGLTANQAVFTDANDTLVSVATTGTGDVVRAASPTLTGTLSAANITATGTMLLAGIISQSSQVSLTGTTGYSTFSSSIATKNDLQDVSINALNAATSSYAVNATIQGQLAGVVSSSTQVKPLLPGGTVSASNQVDITATTGYSTFSSSIATKNNLQDVSITALNAATSSYAINSTIQSQLAGVASSSAQVKAYLPADTVSSSTQVVAGVAAQTIAPTNVNATNILSGSVLQTGTNALIGGKLAVTDSAEFTGTITASNLTANQAVFTNAVDGLVSNAITGTGNVVMSTSPTLVTPILGTPTSVTLTNATGLPVSTGISGLGTNVASALAVNVGSAGAFVTFNGALGTPSSATLTNATGLPVSTGISGLGTGVATFLATPSSANLASAVTDETGTGALVFANSPTLVTPALGTPSSVTLTNATGLPVSTGISGLGANVATFLATPSSANLATAVTDETGTGALVFAGSPTLTGTVTANNIVMSGSQFSGIVSGSGLQYRLVVPVGTNQYAT